MQCLIILWFFDILCRVIEPATQLRQVFGLLFTATLVKSVKGGKIKKSTGRGSARIECTVRVREVGGSNPLAPTNEDRFTCPRFSLPDNGTKCFLAIRAIVG